LRGDVVLEIAPQQEPLLRGPAALVEDLVLGRAIRPVERVVVGELRLVLGRAPRSVGAAREVPAVERIVAVQRRSGLVVFIDARIEEPAVARLAIDELFLARGR